MYNPARDIQKILGDPVFQEFTDNVFKIRRNLIIASFITIFLNLNDIEVTGSNFFGLNLENLTKDNLNFALFVIVLYNFVSFIWYSSDHILFLRNRITGMRTFLLGISAEEADSHHDIRQSTLYNWWLEQKAHLVDFEIIKKQLEEIKNYAVKGHIGTLNNKIQLTLQNFQENTFPSIEKKLDTTLKILSSPRIEESLRRFDRWFWLYQKEQVARLIILEFLFPVALGIWAIVIVFPFDIVDIVSSFLSEKLAYD